MHFKLLTQVSCVATEDMFTTALSNPDKNRNSQHIPRKYIMQLTKHYFQCFFLVFSMLLVERWRVYLKSEYPGYINASYVKVNI